MQNSPMTFTIANVKVIFLVHSPQTQEEIGGYKLERKQSDNRILIKELVTGLVSLPTGLD